MVLVGRDGDSGHDGLGTTYPACRDRVTVTAVKFVGVRRPATRDATSISLLTFTESKQLEQATVLGEGGEASPGGDSPQVRFQVGGRRKPIRAVVATPPE